MKEFSFVFLHSDQFNHFYHSIESGWTFVFFPTGNHFGLLGNKISGGFEGRMGDALKRDTFAGGFIIELLFSEDSSSLVC